MAAHREPHAITAVALTATVLAARWWSVSRHRRRYGKASAARGPWRRTALRTPRTDPGVDRLAELHVSMLDPAADQALRETDGHLNRYWEQLQPLYVRHEDESGASQSEAPAKALDVAVGDQGGGEAEERFVAGVAPFPAGA